MTALLRHLKHGTSTEDNARITEVLQEACSEVNCEGGLLDVIQLAVEQVQEEDSIRFRRLTNNKNTDSSSRHQGVASLSVHPETDTDSSSAYDEATNASDSHSESTAYAYSSEVHWLQAVTMAQLKHAADKSAIHPDSENLPERSRSLVLSCNFWPNATGIRVDALSDPYTLPSTAIAEQLVASYISTVHASFPVLDCVRLQRQVYQQFTTSQTKTTPSAGRKQQAILNLVFAVGAKHLYIADTSLQIGQNDHVIYQLKAQALGLTPHITAEHADILHIRGLGLLSFYLLSIGQIDR
jgi:hypothetical protein